MRKTLLFALLTAALALVAAACTPETVIKEVVVEKEVIKEVEVPGETVIVEKEVVKTVEIPVERIVEKEVVKFIEVEKPPSQFGEAPQLTQQVQAGKLDPVDERLPTQPMIIPVFGDIGKYGGTMRRFYLGPADGCNFFRISKASLVRFSQDGFSLVPAVARGWEPSEDGKEWIFHLREGMRWSDGMPFTADDVMFQYDSILLNDDLTPRPPAILKIADEVGTVEKIDDYTIKYTYPLSNFLVLETAAQADEACWGASRNIPWAPAHYMQQFHIDFNAWPRRRGSKTGSSSTTIRTPTTTTRRSPESPPGGSQPPWAASL